MDYYYAGVWVVLLHEDNICFWHCSLLFHKDPSGMIVCVELLNIDVIFDKQFQGSKMLPHTLYGIIVVFSQKNLMIRIDGGIILKEF